MPTEMIEIARIDWPRVRKEDRTHDREFVKKLALSIETGGMLQAIVVRPDPEEPGRYLGVIGWHRDAAVRDVLGRDLIEARVAVDMDEEEARIARDSENLFRNPLSKSQQARAIARWHDDHDRKRKEYEAARKTQVEADAPKKMPGRPAKAGENPPLGVHGGPSEGNIVEPTLNKTDKEIVAALSEALPPKPPANFAEHVAAITGQSETTVKRALGIGKAFTPAQLEVFSQCAVNQEWMETIAKIEAGSKRDGVINLIASGMEPKEAIAQIQETPEVVSAAGRVYEVNGSSKPGEKAEDDMTDDEWIDFHCADTLKLLPEPTAFRIHAALYRATRDIRQAARTKTRKRLAEAKKEGVHGGYHGVLSRFVNLSHPRHWLRCGSCSGQGLVVEGNSQKRCGECGGNAFVVKFEWS